MGKIKGWKKEHESTNALGKSERWANGNTKIYLYGSIGQGGLRQYTLNITDLKNDRKSHSSNRKLLKNKATAYMRGHPNG